MSLTSYRAAPPRVMSGLIDGQRLELNIVERFRVLRRPGDDLLSRALRRSTIGAEVLNGRVRDGIGFFHLAKPPGRRSTR